MRQAILIAVVALIAAVGPGVARADQPPIEFAGKQFYFSATCTGLGDVILSNQTLARPAALQVVGTNTVVLLAFGNVGHAKIIRDSSAVCTLTGGGFSIDTIEPMDEPIVLPAVIVNG